MERRIYILQMRVDYDAPWYDLSDAWRMERRLFGRFLSYILTIHHVSNPDHFRVCVVYGRTPKWDFFGDDHVACDEEPEFA